MYTLQNKYDALHTEKKSQFYSFLIPVISEEEYKKVLKDIKREYSDATHWCYAVRYMNNNTLIEKSSDNGEPNGTAGKPILNVLKSKELVDVLLVVVRYFGGIMLGIPGLIKAYKGASEKVLLKAQIIPFRKYKLFHDTLSLSDYDSWKYSLEQKGGIIVNISFGIVVEVDYKLPI